MRVRAIDGAGDWLFGKGRNDYKRDTKAVAQSIATRLRSFQNDCFFDVNAGVDWWNLLGSKDLTALKLDISATILNTPDVLNMIELFFDVDPATRNLSISYEVNTVYSTSIRGQETDETVRLLLTESGEVITTEDGEGIEVT